MLETKHLTKSFGGVKAVWDCDFSIEPKKITALIGPNGSGKTTVFNLISGTIKPDYGEVLFKQKNLAKLSVERISNLGVARLFQQSRLFKNLTVKDGLLLALDNEDTKFWPNVFGPNRINAEKEAKVGEILEKLGVAEIAEKLAGDLSFGQKRLAELGRTILNPHELLMLDEPVAGVSPKLRNVIAKILLDLKENGETIFLIEHDMKFTFSVADWVIVMDAGKIIAQDTPEGIKNNPKVLESYLGR